MCIPFRVKRTSTEYFLQRAAKRIAQPRNAIRIQHGAAHRISTFVICSFVLLPFGRNAMARRLPPPAISTQAASAASSGGQRPESSDPLEAAFDHAKLTEPVRQAIRFIMGEADNGKVEIGRLRAANPSKGGMNLYAVYPVYDYRARLAAMLNESVTSTGAEYFNSMIAAGLALNDAAKIAYAQYQNPYKLIDMYGEISDPGNKKKEALIDAGFAILAYFGKDQRTMRIFFGPNWKPDARPLREAMGENLWRTGPGVIPEYYAAALAAPAAHTETPTPDTALHFNSNDLTVKAQIEDWIKVTWTPSIYPDTPKTMPDEVMILAANDPAFRKIYTNDANEDVRAVSAKIGDVYQSILVEYYTVNGRPLHPGMNAQRPLPVVLTEIILRSAKAYSGEDLKKLEQVAADWIAGSPDPKASGYSPNPKINVPKNDPQTGKPLTTPDGSAQYATKDELRSAVSSLIESVHSGNAEQDAANWLRRAIGEADKHAFPAPANAP